MLPLRVGAAVAPGALDCEVGALEDVGRAGNPCGKAGRVEPEALPFAWALEWWPPVGRAGMFAEPCTDAGGRAYATGAALAGDGGTEACDRDRLAAGPDGDFPGGAARLAAGDVGPAELTTV